MRLSPADLAELRRNGVSFADSITPFYAEPSYYGEGGLRLAMDAQPGLITAPNSAIPAFLLNMIDPEVIEILVSPVRAAEVFGEVKKGDWTTLTAQFPMSERTGHMTSYGDYNNNGSAGTNFNWPSRQSCLAQTVSRWGERELDTYGEAKLNYKQEVDAGAALTINKFLNSLYLLGMAGLQNYGAMNDPALSSPIAPTGSWSGLSAVQILADFNRHFRSLQTRLKGLVNLRSELVFVCSPVLETYLTTTNDYNVNVFDLLKKNYPNLRIETIPEYSNPFSSGEFAQLFVPKLQGVDTIYAAFTEKMRAHAVIQDLSSWKQKKSAGGWGSINRRPMNFVSMVGM